MEMKMVRLLALSMVDNDLVQNDEKCRNPDCWGIKEENGVVEDYLKHALYDEEIIGCAWDTHIVDAREQARKTGIAIGPDMSISLIDFLKKEMLPTIKNLAPDAAALAQGIFKEQQ